MCEICIDTHEGNAEPLSSERAFLSAQVVILLDHQGKTIYATRLARFRDFASLLFVIMK